MNTFTNKAKNLLKKLERCETTAYLDEANIYTIGYGHTGPEVLPGVIWTQEQCESELDRDLEVFINGVADLLDGAELTDNQFSALVLFAFNTGLEAFAHSTLLRYLKAGFLDRIPDEMKRWNKVHKGKQLVTSTILTNRRKRESELWNTLDAEPTDQEPNT